MATKSKKFGYVEKLPSNRYRAQYRQGGSVVRAKGTFPTLDAANDWLEREAAEVARPGVEGVDLTARSTFDDWCMLFLKMPRRNERDVDVAGGRTRTSKKAPKTVSSYESILRLHAQPYLGEMRLCDINYQTVLAYQEWLHGRLPDMATSNRKAQVYSRYVFNLANRLGVMVSNPFSDPRITLPDSRVHRDPIEVDHTAVARLVKAVNPRYSTAVFVAAYTGLRAGELWALTRSSVNVFGRELIVSQQVQELPGRGMVVGPMKGGHSRRIALTDQVLAALKVQLASVPNEPDAWLFTTQRGKQVRHAGFMKDFFTPARKAANMPEGFYFHDLRHFCAHWHIGHGVDVYTLMELMGHSSIKVTLDIYGGRFDAKRKEMAAEMTRRMDEEAQAMSADVLAISSKQSGQSG